MELGSQIQVACHVTVDDALELAVKMAGRARKRKKQNKRLRKLADNLARCPYCGDKLIRIHIECEDHSGWTHGWTCNCKENEVRGEKVVKQKCVAA